VTKGGSASIPTLKGGVFSLRPLHPRKINIWIVRTESIIRYPAGEIRMHVATKIRIHMTSDQEGVFWHLSDMVGESPPALAESPLLNRGVVHG
jgi:hypothetical protein